MESAASHTGRKRGQVLHDHCGCFTMWQRNRPTLSAKTCSHTPSASAYREGPCGCAGCGYRPVMSLYPCMFVGVTCTISTPAPLLIFP
jgi:hypothetical protein